MSKTLTDSPLGKTSKYIQTYSRELLFPIPRKMARDLIGLGSPLPFDGGDTWYGYELSWLNPKGKPQIALGKFTFPCTAEHVVESKSFKLYLNSFNQTPFESQLHVKETIEKDLSQAVAGPVTVELYLPTGIETVEGFPGTCLDDLDIETATYQVEPKFLKATPAQCEETLFSHLLKSNCLATGQPDWGSVLIRYAGPRIDQEGLLKYFVSYRNHSGFAEHCVEQMFHDILIKCRPVRLTVYAHFTRRGGLDINPFRSNFERSPPNIKALRQ